MHPRPEQVANIAAEAVDLLFRTIQGERWIATFTLSTPKASSEPSGQSPAPGPVPVGTLVGRMPEHRRACRRRLVRIALHLAERRPVPRRYGRHEIGFRRPSPSSLDWPGRAHFQVVILQKPSPSASPYFDHPFQRPLQYQAATRSPQRSEHQPARHRAAGRSTAASRRSCRSRRGGSDIAPKPWASPPLLMQDLARLFASLDIYPHGPGGGPECAAYASPVQY